MRVDGQLEEVRARHLRRGDVELDRFGKGFSDLFQDQAVSEDALIARQFLETRWLIGLKSLDEHAFAVLTYLEEEKQVTLSEK